MSCEFCKDFYENGFGKRIRDLDGDEAQILTGDFAYLRVWSDGVSAEVNIEFCPWCGDELKYRYGLHKNLRNKVMKHA